MKYYRPDLGESEPGKPIDVIEFQARHPERALPPDPRILENLLCRDLWTRIEALLILAGFQPDNEVTNAHGIPCVLGHPGVGCDYLDGTNDAALSQVGLLHPLKDYLQSNYRALRWYSQGQPLDESKPPQEWLAWAETKGFKPYWLDDWRSAGTTTMGIREGETAISGEDLRAFETLQEHEWNGGAIDYERWTEKSDTLTAAQAARLMSGLDPESFVDLGLVRSDAAGPAKQRARRFEQLAAANDPPKERDTPIGWLIWAHKKHEKVHSPFRAFVVATQKEQASIDELERAALIAYREQCQRQEDEKMAAGRYTLQEAAESIARNTGERGGDLQAKLVQAVTDGLLAVYRPGEMAQYQPKTVRWFYEEAYWDDLNVWLGANEPRITWRFPAPDQASAEHSGADSAAMTEKPQAGQASKKPLQRQSHQEQEILRVIDQLGHDPEALPRHQPGKPGVKAAVRNELQGTSWQGRVFEKAWERLRADGRIKDRE